MPTDDERREVARRLRELEVCEFDGEFIDRGEVENALGLMSDDGAWYEAEGVTRLADLIEPSGHECVPGECPLNVRHDNDRIDQERLLATATVMAADSVRSVKQGISVSPVYILHAARDIAEACGETLGSIRNRELAEWGTSVVPKETVVDRDALLAAWRDEMARLAMGAGHPYVAKSYLTRYASRIRKVLNTESPKNGWR